LWFWSREIESRAAINHALGSNLPSVTIYDALNRCESDAGAFEFVRPVQTLKHTNQFVYILHIKTHAIVPNEYYQLICVPVGASDLDFCTQARASEFDGIRNKVDQRNS
jgi:hypothetical protein